MGAENDERPPAPPDMPVVAYGAGTGEEADGTIVEVLRSRSLREEKPDVRRMRALERDLRAVKMRRDGITYDVISKRLGYGDRANASRAVKRRLTEFRAQCAEDVAELRQVETLRLDTALAAIMPRVRDGELLAIDRMLRIQERRAAYEGLDQPKSLKVEVAREIEGVLDKLRESFDDGTYERILAVVAGELGSSTPGGDPPAEDPGGSSPGGGGAGADSSAGS
jgi:hypothetical protein